MEKQFPIEEPSKVMEIDVASLVGFKCLHRPISVTAFYPLAIRVFPILFLKLGEFI